MADSKAMPSTRLNDPDVRSSDDDDRGERDVLAKRADEDQLAYVTRLSREARLTGDPRAQLAHEDALEQLGKDQAIPNPMIPSEGEIRANRVVALVGDGLPEDDASDPRWRELERLTGYPLGEIGAVQVGKEGVAVLHRAGGVDVWYLYVGDDHPKDGQGRRGVMLLERPANYRGPFPVFGQPDAADENRTGIITTGRPTAPGLNPLGPVI